MSVWVVDDKMLTVAASVLGVGCSELLELVLVVADRFGDGGGGGGCMASSQR